MNSSRAQAAFVNCCVPGAQCLAWSGAQIFVEWINESVREGRLAQALGLLSLPAGIPILQGPFGRPAFSISTCPQDSNPERSARGEPGAGKRGWNVASFQRAALCIHWKSPLSHLLWRKQREQEGPISFLSTPRLRISPFDVKVPGETGLCHC